MARPEGYIRTFVDEGEPMVRSLHLARPRQSETEYVSELLSAIEKTSEVTKPPTQKLVEPLAACKVEVSKLTEVGYSNQEIADKLVISFTAVKRDISNIYTKLYVKSRTQAIAIGKR